MRGTELRAGRGPYALALLIAIALVTPASAAAAPADLDLSFDDDGKATFDSGRVRIPDQLGSSPIFKAVDADGRAYYAGGAQQDTLLRLTPEGAVDTSFGGGDGEVQLGADPGDLEEYHAAATITGVAIDGSGRPVVVLYVKPSMTPRDDTNGPALGGVAVVRLTTSGTLDPTFGGGDGLVRPYPDDWATGFTPQGQHEGMLPAFNNPIDVRGGRIAVVVIRQDGDGSNHRYGLMMLTADGDLDPNFSGDGFAFLGPDLILEPEIGSDGKVSFYGVGESGGTVGNGQSYVGRATTAGVLDPGFGDAGYFVFDPTAFGVDAFNASQNGSFALDGLDRPLVALDGRIVDEGTGDQSLRGLLVRLSAAGAVDGAFGPGSADWWEFANVLTVDVAIAGNDRPVLATTNPSGGAGNALRRFTAAGALDPSFDGDGISTALDSFGLLAIDGSDRIYTGHHSETQRLSAAGALDAGYDPDVRILHNSKDEPSATFVDSRGRTLVALPPKPSGIYMWESGYDPRYRVLRLDADGQRDLSFGAGGEVQAPGQLAESGSPDHADFYTWEPSDIVELPDGGYLITDDYGVWKVNSDGNPVEDFGEGGYLEVNITDPFNGRAFADQSLIDSQGRILVISGAVRIVRFSADGEQDMSFAGDGVAGEVYSHFGYDATLDSQGRILIAGDGFVQRFTPDGLADSSFSNTIVENEVSVPGSFYAVEVDSSDRPVLAGATGGAPTASPFCEPSDQAALVARLTTGGALDTGFSGDGLAHPDTTGSTGTQFNGSCLNDVRFDPDGRLLVAGTVRQATGGAPVSLDDFFVARLDGNGSNDSGFDGDGVRLIDFQSHPVTFEDPRLGLRRLDAAGALAARPDGRIMLAGVRREPAFGYEDFPPDNDVALARLEGTAPTNKTLTVRHSGGGSGLVTSNPAGISCGGFCAKAYAPGTSVTLSADPDPGTSFEGWQGCDSVSSGQCTVQMSELKTVTATFTPITHTLTVEKNGTGSGKVTGDGIDCGADCSEEVEQGTTVELTADPDPGSELAGWSGCDSVAGDSCQLEIDSDKTATATFQPTTATQRTLTVSKSGAGTGTVSSTPAGIDCGADCTDSFNDGTTVTLEAIAAEGSIFNGWSGCGSVTGEGDCVVSMTQNRTVTANFGTEGTGEPQTLTAQKAGSGSGTITASGIDCGSDCSESYPGGTTVVLDATADSGSTFSSWSGCDQVAGASCTVQMNAARTVTATFTEDTPTPTTRTLTVNRTGSGSGTVTGPGINCGADCSQGYPEGSVVDLEADPAAGSELTGWSGCDLITGGGEICRVTMTASRAVSAIFAKSAPNLPETKITKVKVKKKTATVSFNGSGGSGQLRFECKLDKGAFKSCSSPKKLKVKKGKHTVLVRAIDSTNAADPTPAKAKFKVKG